MDTCNMMDAWRRHFPVIREYTRMPAAPGQVAKRLDYILLNKGIENTCLEAGIMPASGLPWDTDHASTFVKLLSLPIAREELRNIIKGHYSRQMISTTIKFT